MAVSMISMNSISFSNYDAGSTGGGSSGLLDFSSPSSGDAGAAGPQMDTSAQMAPMDTSTLQAPMPDSSAMQGPSDSFQPSSAPGPAAYSPPPEAMPGPSGSFDFVA